MITKIIGLTIDNLNEFASDFLIPRKLNREDLESFILKINSNKPLLITLKSQL